MLKRFSKPWNGRRNLLNDTVEITFARYNLTSAKKFRVIGLIEDAANNEIDLELWG